jgi:hypothetical protein
MNVWIVPREGLIQCMMMLLAIRRKVGAGGVERGLKHFEFERRIPRGPVFQ